MQQNNQVQVQNVINRFTVAIEKYPNCIETYALFAQVRITNLKLTCVLAGKQNHLPNLQLQLALFMRGEKLSFNLYNLRKNCVTVKFKMHYRSILAQILRQTGPT